MAPTAAPPPHQGLGEVDSVPKHSTDLPDMACPHQLPCTDVSLPCPSSPERPRRSGAGHGGRIWQGKALLPWCRAIFGRGFPESRVVSVPRGPHHVSLPEEHPEPRRPLCSHPSPSPFQALLPRGCRSSPGQAGAPRHPCSKMSPRASLPTPESPQPPLSWRRILSWLWQRARRSGLGSHPEWHCQLSRRRHLASRPRALHHCRALRVTAAQREGTEPAARREQGRAGSVQPPPLSPAPRFPPGSAPLSRHPGSTCRDSKATVGTGFQQGVQGWGMLRVGHSPRSRGLAVLREEEEAWRGTHGKMEKRSSAEGMKGRGRPQKEDQGLRCVKGARGGVRVVEILQQSPIPRLHPPGTRGQGHPWGRGMVTHGAAGTTPTVPRSHQRPPAPCAGEEPIPAPSLDARSPSGCIPRAALPSQGRERGCCAALSLRRRAGSVPAGATASLQTSLTPPKVTLSLLQPGPGTPGGDRALRGHPELAAASRATAALARTGLGVLNSAYPKPAAPNTRPGPTRPPGAHPGVFVSLPHAGALPVSPALRRLSGSRSLAGSIHNGYRGRAPGGRGVAAILSASVFIPRSPTPPLSSAGGKAARSGAGKAASSSSPAPWSQGGSARPPCQTPPRPARSPPVLVLVLAVPQPCSGGSWDTAGRAWGG